MGFRSDFVWGAASAAYQVEGAAFEDGKGKSVWDMFSHLPGKTFEGDNGDVACNHYHLYKDDVKMMKDLGLKSYRLSLSWPRILPDGVGRINPKGLDFYDSLVDELLNVGIEPYITLFHWDFPLELYYRGGWLSRDSPEWFAEYTKVVSDRLSDRVSNWMTLNEPNVYIVEGHHTADHAPGRKYSMPETLRVLHHSMMAHGRSVQTLREMAKIKPNIGIALNVSPHVPVSDSPEDIEAARLSNFSAPAKSLWESRWYFDPIFCGSYPEEGVKNLPFEFDWIKDGDMDICKQPLDFLGLNMYLGEKVKADPSDPKGFKEVKLPPGTPRNALQWPVIPEITYWGPKYYYDRYKLPIYITENGMAGHDWVSSDGAVHDPLRIDFLQNHLKNFKRAAEDGVDVRGYFQWSIMDNLEWSDGFRERFGIVHVDYTTQKRIPKDSAHWYKRIIEENGESL